LTRRAKQAHEYTIAKSEMADALPSWPGEATSTLIDLKRIDLKRIGPPPRDRARAPGHQKD